MKVLPAELSSECENVGYAVQFAKKKKAFL